MDGADASSVEMKPKRPPSRLVSFEQPSAQDAKQIAKNWLEADDDDGDPKQWEHNPSLRPPTATEETNSSGEDTDFPTPRTMLKRQPSIQQKLWGKQDEIRNSEWGIDTKGHCVIHPSSTFRRNWNVLAMVLILYTSFYIPIGLAFIRCSGPEDWHFWFNVLMDVFFITDLILNFYTGYFEDEALILDLKKIRRKYLCSIDFLVDFVSTIPVDYFAISASDCGASQSARAGKIFRTLKVFRIFRLLRLLRLGRLFRYAQLYTEQYGAAFVRILRLLFLIMMFTHWNACLVFLIAHEYGSEDESELTWVYYLDIEDARISTQYSWALFTSLSHMLCIGYGVTNPVVVPEVWVTTFSMTSGAVLLGCVVGSITTVMLSLDSSGQRFSSHMDEVEAFTSRRNVSPDLRERIRTYMKLRYRHTAAGMTEEELEGQQACRMFNEDQIVGELSVGIRRELQVNLTNDTLIKTPFFSDLKLPQKIAQYMVSDFVERECRIAVFRPTGCVPLHL